MIGGGEVRGMSFGMDSAFGISVLLDDDDDMMVTWSPPSHPVYDNTCVPFKQGYAGIHD